MSVKFGLKTSCVSYYQNLSVNCLISRAGEFWSDAFICILISENLSVNCLKNHVGELSRDILYN